MAKETMHNIESYSTWGESSAFSCYKVYEFHPVKFL